MLNVNSLNYHHLLYFWTVAKEGSVTLASEKLHLSQPTVSSQIKKFEQSLKAQLFQRSGRELVLTDFGKTVYRYAERIFSISQDLTDELNGRPTGRSIKLKVGVPEVLPKLIAFRLLSPVLQQDNKVQIICREGPIDQLLLNLASHDLDVVLSDSPAGSMSHVKAFNHPLGECGVGIFGVKKLCNKYNKNLPDTLNSAPFLLPTENTALRRSIDRWVLESNLNLDVVGEMDDTALLKVFAESGMGFVPGPLAIKNEIELQFGLKLLFEIPRASETFYAITVERRVQDPMVLAIAEAAKTTLFSS